MRAFFLFCFTSELLEVDYLIKLEAALSPSSHLLFMTLQGSRIPVAKEPAEKNELK